MTHLNVIDYVLVVNKKGNVWATVVIVCNWICIVSSINPFPFLSLKGLLFVKTAVFSFFFVVLSPSTLYTICLKYGSFLFFVLQVKDKSKSIN